MTGMAKHSAPPAAEDGRPHRDRLLPVLFLIVGCGLLEVWASWLTLGSVSGFPKLGRMTTGWILPVTTEAYWSIAVVAWLADPAGAKSRRFAMCTAGVVFALSLAGQELGHVTAASHRPAPMGLVMFVTALPLVAVALGAVLIHLRQADREEAGVAARAAREAARRAAEDAAAADERTWLRRELEALSARRDEDVSALRAELDEAASALASARRDAAESLRRAEALERRLSAASDRGRPRKAPAPDDRKSAQAGIRDGDLTTELLAYMELKDNPEMRKPRKGGDLARKLGVSGATARRYREKFLNPDGSLRELPVEPLASQSG